MVEFAFTVGPLILFVKIFLCSYVVDVFCQARVNLFIFSIFFCFHMVKASFVVFWWGVFSTGLVRCRSNVSGCVGQIKVFQFFFTTKFVH